MTLSTEWEQLYQANTQMSIWPWSDLVSYVMRYARPRDKNFRVLELGCGAGANIPFFKHLRVQYHAIDGSETSVRRLAEHFSEYKATIKVGDFTNEIPFEGVFDLIVDRSSLTCGNTTTAIKRGIKLVEEKLAVNGKFIGIDWFSTAHSSYLNGIQAGDAHTKTGFVDGPFQGLGKIHFSDRNHLVELFSGFRLPQLEHKVVSTVVPNNGLVVATWNFLAVRDASSI